MGFNRTWDSGITLESTHVGKPIEKYLLGMVEIYTNHENVDDLETVFCWVYHILVDRLEFGSETRFTTLKSAVRFEYLYVYCIPQ